SCTPRSAWSGGHASSPNALPRPPDGEGGCRSTCWTEEGAPMADTVKGACLCGAVQFEVTLPTLGCCHCHCSICRRFCGAGYGTFFRVRRQQFRLLAGEEHLQRYRSSPWAQRVFCNTCGSSL